MKKILLYVIVILFTNDLKSQDVNQTISDKDKIIGLSTYWKEASYNFVYFDRIPKLNWDSAYAAYIPKVLATKNLFEYSRELKKFAGLLQDGHSDVSYASIDTLFIKRSFGKYKIELKEFDNKFFVINTAEKTKEEIPIGSEIISVNNIPAEKYLKENILPFFSSNREYISREMAVNGLLMGLKGTSVKIEIKTPENKIKLFDLERKFVEGKWQIEQVDFELSKFKWINDKIAYIALNSFQDSNIVNQFEAIIPELEKCKGLVLDIRKNGGGSEGYARSIVQYLTDKPYFFGEHGKTRKLLSSHKAWGVFAQDHLTSIKLDTSSMEFKKIKNSEEYKQMYEYYLYSKGDVWEDEKLDTIYNTKSIKLLMPLVVLAGGGTASAAEDLLIMLNNVNRGKLFGEKTFGSTGQPLCFDLPCGGSARVCSRRCTYPNGKEFVGIGIIPDMEIKMSYSDYINKKDIVLDKAIEYLTRQIK